MKANRLSTTQYVATCGTVLWGLFGGAAMLGTMSTEFDYVVIGWWVAALTGITGCILALRGNSSGKWLAAAAAVVLLGTSCVYWFIVVEQMTLHDPQPTLAGIAGRIWNATAIGLASATAGTATWLVATVYRELVMPLLQAGVLLALGLMAFVRSQSPRSPA